MNLSKAFYDERKPSAFHISIRSVVLAETDERAEHPINFYRDTTTSQKEQMMEMLIV